MAEPATEPLMSGWSAERLLGLVFDRPADAVAIAEAGLRSSPAPAESAIAHHVIGLALRESGDLRGSIRHLRLAIMLARSAGSVAREADVLATMGVAQVYNGQAGSGLESLDSAVRLTRGGEQARNRFRRAAALWMLGRSDEAREDVRAALPALRRAGDLHWTARTLTLRANLHIRAGNTERADQDYRAAEAIYDSVGSIADQATSRHNRGVLASYTGDIPGALRWLDDAERRHRKEGRAVPELAVDRCAVLISAGLVEEARARADAAADDLRSRGGPATRRAELLFVAATAAIAAGDPDGAMTRAQTCLGLVVRQGSEWWELRTRLLVMQIRFRAGAPMGRLLGPAIDVADRLQQLGSPQTVEAQLFAGRVAARLRRLPVAQDRLSLAAAGRHRGPAATRVAGWLARALLMELTGDSRATLAACRSGFAVLRAYQLSLGAAELRAHAMAAGIELAEIAQRATLRSGRARRLLVWSERWRATANAVPSIRPPEDPAVRSGLTALREVSMRLERAREQGSPTTTLERERARLEALVRDRARHARTGGGALSDLFTVDQLLDRLGGGRLIEIVECDGALHALVCGDGRVRRIAIGSAASALAAVERAHWILRAGAYRGGRPRELAGIGERLQRELLGSVATMLGDETVVIVPPGRLQAVPWALLPALAARPHTVAPSARAWLKAAGTAAPAGAGVVVVRGPDLTGAGAEVDAVAALYPGATLLAEGEATSGAVIAALDGAAQAHIAAHGEFRADNPLFTSLRMSDGPLTVYDLEQIRRAPHRVVLPSCDTGRVRAVGGDEVLGLAAVLLAQGTAGLVAPLVPVNDAATVPVMVALHESLAAGSGLAEALCFARRRCADDPAVDVAASSFVAFGAG